MVALQADAPSTADNASPMHRPLEADDAASSRKTATLMLEAMAEAAVPAAAASKGSFE